MDTQFDHCNARESLRWKEVYKNSGEHRSSHPTAIFWERWHGNECLQRLGCVTAVKFEDVKVFAMSAHDTVATGCVLVRTDQPRLDVISHVVSYRFYRSLRTAGAT